MNKERMQCRGLWATKGAARFAIMPFVVAIALGAPFMTTNADRKSVV